MSPGADSNSSQTDGNHPVTVLAVISLACAGASFFLVVPLFLGVAADIMGLSHGQIGMLAGIELMGAAIGSVAAVFWIPHVNWRAATYFSLGIIIGGNLLSGAIDQLNYLFAIRFLTGLLGESSALIEAGGISGVLTPLAVFAFLVLAIVPVISARVARRSGADAGREAHSVFPVFLALGAQLVWSIGVGAVWAFIERIGLAVPIELAAVGAALAIGVGVGMFGALLAVVAGKSRSRLCMFALAMAGQITALFVLVDASSWISFTLAVSLLSLSWNFALPFVLGTIAAYDKASRFIVLVIAAQGLGVAIGPVIAGHLSDHMGLASVAYLAITACIISVCILTVTHALANRSMASATQGY